MSAVLVGAAIALLVVVAASSAPVRVFTTTSSSSDVAPAAESARPADVITTTPDTPVDLVDRPGDPGPWLQIIGIIAVLAAVLMARRVGWTLERVRERVGRRGRRGWLSSVLPVVEVHPLEVDVETARATLADGAPRNAIVACWMQLERDAAAAGLPRRPAETSMEYVERVVGASSVDPAPIADLAALYREARYSRHELDDGHRRRAAAALDRVAAALERVEVDA